jgi:hypothetical protein
MDSKDLLSLEELFDLLTKIETDVKGLKNAVAILMGRGSTTLNYLKTLEEKGYPEGLVIFAIGDEQRNEHIAAKMSSLIKKKEMPLLILEEECVLDSTYARGDISRWLNELMPVSDIDIRQKNQNPFLFRRYRGTNKPTRQNMVHATGYKRGRKK